MPLPADSQNADVVPDVWRHPADCIPPIASRRLHPADRSYACQQGFYPTVSVRMPLDAAVPTTQGGPRVMRNCVRGLFFARIDSTTTAFPTPAHDFFAHGLSYVDEDVRRRNHSPQPVPER